MQGHYFNVVFLHRFWRLQRVIFPRWRSVSVLLFVFLLAVVILQQIVIYQVGVIPSRYYKVLGDKDLQGFKQATGFAIGIIVGIALLTATSKYVSSVFYVTSRKMVTKHIHSLYFIDVHYYNLNVLDDSIDNPDQRITQDVDKLCQQYSSIVAELLISPFIIVYYMYTTWINTGYLGPVCVILFFIMSSIINKFLMSPVVALVYKQEAQEGNFRFKHMMIRSNAESAAFYRAGRTELKKADCKLDTLIKTQQQLILRQYFLNFSMNMASYLGSILSYIILAIPIFSGFYDHLSPSELSALISQNAFVTIYLINCFTRLIDMSVTVSNMAGFTHRVGQLLEQLAKMEAECKGGPAPSVDGACSPSYSSLERSERKETAYTVDELTYSPPERADCVLVRGLSFEVETGRSILITGDSGCGKSSLLRVMDTIWTELSGCVKRNVQKGPRGVLILPQKPFLTDGSLREQIIYPYSVVGEHGVDDPDIMEHLQEADLMTLYTRIGGLDVQLDWNWYDMLSPGEMQRLSFVRLFYHRPLFAMLDEATSQIGAPMEHALYTRCQTLGITLVSVGHRQSLRSYHQVELHLDGRGGWALTEIPQQQQPQPPPGGAGPAQLEANHS